MIDPRSVSDRGFTRAAGNWIFPIWRRFKPVSDLAMSNPPPYM
ncbi:hypothetical protein BBAL3_2641 [Brevundimonas sp. BAL3]|nr:hypothetical protein BBAL3_2641 [Brevundimonas sp. BAL3]